MTLLHVVTLAARPGMTSTLNEALDRASELRALPGVESFEAGADVSIEGLADGMTHAIVVGLADESARKAYLASPEHQQVANELERCIDRITVLDIRAHTHSP